MGSDNGNGNRLPTVLFVAAIILWLIAAGVGCYVVWLLPWLRN